MRRRYDTSGDDFAIILTCFDDSPQVRECARDPRAESLAYRLEISRPSRRIPAPPRNTAPRAGREGTTADPITPGGERPSFASASEDELRGDGDRTCSSWTRTAPRDTCPLINHDGEVFALDSLCYHAGVRSPRGTSRTSRGVRACLARGICTRSRPTGEKLYGSTRLDDDGVTLRRRREIRRRSASARTETELREDGWQACVCARRRARIG